MKIGKMKFFQKTTIGGKENPLLLRYILIRFPRFGIYLHHMLRSDYDRALHDHPWPFISFVLAGGYTEVHDQTIDGKQVRVEHKPGSILLRPAEWRHRFVLKGLADPNATQDRFRDAWTLVIVGRRQRKWGFFLPTGWCWWRQHDDGKNICSDEILYDYNSD